ncbi:MAG: hypothetical protein ACE37H_11295 [Phycisphaeraceae bacterium]
MARPSHSRSRSLEVEVHAQRPRYDNAGELVPTMTYVVVAFSILVGGLMMGPMLRRLGLSSKGGAADTR